MTRSWSSNLILTLLILLTACVTPRDELASAGDRGAAEATTSAVLEETSVAAEEADKTYVPPVMPDDPDPALWVISDDDTTIYLFGTIHLLKPGLTWFDEAVKTAFDRKSLLVFSSVRYPLSTSSASPQRTRSKNLGPSIANSNRLSNLRA